MKRPLIFTVVVLVLTWGLLLICGLAGILSGPMMTLIFGACMLLPAVANILTRLITKQGFHDMKLRPRFKGNIKFYLLAWFSPAVLMALGAIVYFVIFPDKFDPTMKVINETLEAQGLQGLEGASTLLVISQLASAILLAPFINLIFALGEELGWRGYLLPQLCNHLSVAKSILISTVIWGVWHAPMIAMGHNYGLGYPGAPWLGIGAMILFCMAIGSIFSYLSLKTNSALPAALGHGALNAIVSAPILFATDYNRFIGPMMIGLVGGSALIVAAVFFFWKSTKLVPAKSE